MTELRLNSAGVNALILDLNGTMVRDAAYHKEAFHRLFMKHGIVLSEAEYEIKVANRLNKEIWREVFGDGLTPDQLQALTREKEEAYEALVAPHLEEVAGLTTLLRQARNHHIRLALATSSGRQSTAFLLDRLGLEDAFELMVTGGDISHGKPDPEIYIQTLDRLELPAEEVVAFEDSPQGVQAAVLAGITTYGILSSYSEEQLQAAGATACFPDFTYITIT